MCDVFYVVGKTWCVFDLCPSHWYAIFCSLHGSVYHVYGCEYFLQYMDKLLDRRPDLE